MFFWEELLLILGLSMDGFAASVCLGMETENKKTVSIVLAIGGFHTGMLLLGFALGAGARGLAAGLIPWLAAAILTLLGLHMLRAAARQEPEEPQSGGTAAGIAALAFATSVDAMTVGAALALMDADPWQAAALTALVMGSLSVIGAVFGGRFGKKHRRAARLAGGAVLAALGLKGLIGLL